MTGAKLRVVVFCEATGWHEKCLLRAFAAQGIDAQTVSLRQCGFAADGAISLAHVKVLPDAVFVRAIPAGSFEQVTLRLSLLHALQHAGVVVCNSATVVERTVDKSMTSFLLARAGVPTLPAWVCESEARAKAIAAREFAAGERLVLKPLFGSQGRGLSLLRRVGDLPDVTALAGGVFYLQRFVATAPSGGCDYRVMVVGDEAIAAMRRSATNWITNRARGGKVAYEPVDSDLAQTALAAARCVGASYAGVDLIRDAGGRTLVLEVNGIPAWRGLQEVTDIDIAGRLALHLSNIAAAANGVSRHYD